MGCRVDAQWLLLIRKMVSREARALLEQVVMVLLEQVMVLLEQVMVIVVVVAAAAAAGGLTNSPPYVSSCTRPHHARTVRVTDRG